MKNLLPAVVFITMILFGYILGEYPSLPQRVQYVPDLVIAGVGAIAVARLVATQRIFTIPLRYLLVFLGFCYVVVAGAVINDVSPDVIFAGIRTYFRCVPLFLLPFAFDYSRKDVRKQFLVLLALALVQVPVAFHQRFFEGGYELGDTEVTGDNVTGTLGASASGTLSIFLVSTALMVIACYMGKRISLGWTSGLVLLLLLPTAINETKVSPILALVGGIGLCYAKRRELNIRQVAFVGALACIFFGSFVVAYDELYSKRKFSSDYVTSMKSSTSYNLHGVRVGSLRTLQRHPEIVAKPAPLEKATDYQTHVQRFDSLRIPFDVFLPDDPMRFIFGVGVGNVTSTFGHGGQYRDFAIRLGATATTVTQLLWECGALGTTFYLLFLAMVLKDSLSLSAGSEWSHLAAGWVGVLLIVLFICVYTSIFIESSLSALIAFFSGLVVSKQNTLRVLPSTPKRGRSASSEAA